MKKPTKTAAKPAAKPVVAAKRPRTYKKSDLPRTARAYLNAMGDKNMEKENEAVALLIELHAAVSSDYAAAIEELSAKRAEQQMIQTVGYGHQSITPYELSLPKKPTLREQFLAWIGVKNG